MCKVEDFVACTLSSDASCLNITLLCWKGTSVGVGLGASEGVGGDVSAHLRVGVCIGLGLGVGVCAGIDLGVGIVVGEDTSFGVSGCFNLCRSLAI